MRIRKEEVDEGKERGSDLWKGMRMIAAVSPLGLVGYDKGIFGQCRTQNRILKHHRAAFWKLK